MIQIAQQAGFLLKKVAGHGPLSPVLGLRPELLQRP